MEAIIQNNIPIPPRRTGKAKEYYRGNEIYDLLKNVNDSIVVKKEENLDILKISIRLCRLGRIKKEGHTFTYRTIDEGYRIWREK